MQLWSIPCHIKNQTCFVEKAVSYCFKSCFPLFSFFCVSARSSTGPVMLRTVSKILKIPCECSNLLRTATLHLLTLRRSTPGCIRLVFVSWIGSASPLLGEPKGQLLNVVVPLLLFLSMAGVKLWQVMWGQEVDIAKIITLRILDHQHYSCTILQKTDYVIYRKVKYCSLINIAQSVNHLAEGNSIIIALDMKIKFRESLKAVRTIPMRLEIESIAGSTISRLNNWLSDQSFWSVKRSPRCYSFVTTSAIDVEKIKHFPCGVLSLGVGRMHR